jgi:hypothetical protein
LGTSIARALGQPINTFEESSDWREGGLSVRVIEDFDLLHLGQSVRTAFGRGEIASISHIDSLVYVRYADSRDLYIFRPEQVELDEQKAEGDK